MKKLLLGLIFMAGCSPAFAFDFSDLKTQLVDQTKVAIFTDGGAASFYDFSVGRSNAVRAGAVAHILTNRFIQVDLGWAGGFDGHTDGILTGGPSVRFDKLVSTFFPATTALKYLVPPVLQKLYAGVSLGWNISDGSPHSLCFLGYDFN